MSLRRAIAVVGLVLAIAGCAAKPQAGGGGWSPGESSTTRVAGRTSPESSDQNVDPCAMRLHDLCAPLLLYFARNQQLPSSAEELKTVPGFESLELTCPVSGENYAYNPHGPTAPQAGRRFILYDATPAHAGRRWGIAVGEPNAGQALVARVMAMPQSIFDKR